MKAAAGTTSNPIPAQMGNANTLVTATGGGSVLTQTTGATSTNYILHEGKVYAAGTITANATANTISVARGAEVTDKETLSLVAPLASIDAAIQDVDNLRSDLGAVQNRFESTIANLNNTVTNLSASRSRIEDADYAVEVSNMTRAQILQQAGTSVLAQANQVPQTVLSLLR